MPAASRKSANRRNAQASTGPKSVAGKRRSAANATKHGLLATASPIIRGEALDTWLAHEKAVMASLAPSDALQRCLASRIALLLWRLERTARAEVAMLNLAAVEKHDDDTPVANIRAWRDTVHAFNDGTLVDIDADDALTVLHYVDATCRFRLAGGRDAATCETWTPALLKGLIEAYAKTIGSTVAFVLTTALNRVDSELRLAESREALKAARRLTTVVLNGEHMERVTRYETHLDRMLSRALDQYAALRRQVSTDDLASFRNITPRELALLPSGERPSEGQAFQAVPQTCPT